MPGYQFASDNTAGACPEALAAFVEANAAAVPSYGNDRYTAEVSDRLRELFETPCEVFFVFNGTAANSLAVSACCRPYHSVICSDMAHLETDECGGPEFFSGGSKILLAASHQGKLDPAAIEELATHRSDIHYPKPRLVSLTLPTELGTLYTLEELDELGRLAKRLGLRVHVDGARFANAVAALGATPAEIVRRGQVDVLCLGGTKIGLPVGEAVIFFDCDLAGEFAYRCKQAGQLASKMRFLTAPWLGMLSSDAWLRHAAHANAMAGRLAAGFAAIPEVELPYPTQANAVFAALPRAIHQRLQARGWHYYTFIGQGAARFMCSWATTETDVDALLGDARGE
ncbi:MAG: low specificity L-threonine aldolase [Pirellulales bacterium]|nr:low specificity L-threonine aldolase [Pirellulales bacterium]